LKNHLDLQSPATVPLMRRVLRPRWLVGHVVVLALVVGLVNLGFWQLRRLEQRRETNALVRSRMAASAGALDEVMAPDVGKAQLKQVEYRRVTAMGTYDPDGQVLVRARQLEGRPGNEVLTPLVLGNGAAVIVNRGWVPTDAAGQVTMADVIPPTGQVEVTGLLRQTQRRGRFGPKDPEGGRLREVVRIDIERLQRQSSIPLRPAWLQMQTQTPAQLNGLPEPLPPPELDEGRHLTYALQWFLFAAMALAGWGVAIVRTGQTGRLS
jgi:surfeit locus 1 family protein